MPYIKRWFPVSHDINSDPEVIELTDKFGLMGLKVWLELLSIADRNDGRLGDDINRLARGLSLKLGSYQGRVSLILGWIEGRTWLERDNGLRVRNFSKYHRTREPNKVPPDLPDLPDENSKKNSLNGAGAPSDQALFETPLNSQKEDAQKADMTPLEFAESWNEIFDGLLPKVVLPLAPSRGMKAKARLKEHPEMQFWEKVFRNISSSDFLLGKKSAWKCNFDFLITNDSNCLKIYEGAFDNGKDDQKRYGSFQRR